MQSAFHADSLRGSPEQGENNKSDRKFQLLQSLPITPITKRMDFCSFQTQSCSLTMLLWVKKKGGGEIVGVQERDSLFIQVVAQVKKKPVPQQLSNVHDHCNASHITLNSFPSRLPYKPLPLCCFPDFLPTQSWGGFKLP